jgi:8-oxo-dGTP pyrophosphatase MutT (NUDIX family)
MDQDLQQPVVAAGVILRSPAGRILMLNRTDGMGWAFPGGGLKDGETPERAAFRECWEETGHRCGGLKFLMQRTKDDGRGLVTFHTYIADCPDEFVPTLNHEHSSFGWFDSNEMLTEHRSDSMARADSAERADAVPVVGGEGHAKLEASLKEGLEQDERERVAGQDQNLEEELGEEEGPAAPAPLYPVADFPVADQDPPGEDEPDYDDISDDVLDLALSVLGDLQERLERLEAGVRD